MRKRKYAREKKKEERMRKRKSEKEREKERMRERKKERKKERKRKPLYSYNKRQKEMKKAPPCRSCLARIKGLFTR